MSAVFMSEYSNRQDRGRLVGLVFSMQALGSDRRPAGRPWCWCLGHRRRADLAPSARPRRLPAAAVVYLRSKMPESPRYLAQVQGNHAGPRRNSDSPRASSPNPLVRAGRGEPSAAREFLTNRARSSS